MTSKEIIEKLKTLGSENIKKIFSKHGAREPFYGVKVEDLKKIQKVVKKDYQLSLELYDSGISDAMYLAGLIADETKMTKVDLQQWAEKAYWYMLSEFTVAWVAAESRYGLELALEWIESKNENIAAAGWSTLSNLVALKTDAELDMVLYKKLLTRVAKDIHSSQNRVRNTMNGFVIAVGSYSPTLTADAIATAKKIGTVMVDMGDTSCKVPNATDYINKCIKRGTLGKQKKTVRC